MIGALIWKDIKLFFRNRFFAVITALGLVFYIVLYFLLPSEVNNTFNAAVYLENPAETTVDETLAEFFNYKLFPSQEAMLAALENKDENYFVGLSISAEQAAAITQGQPAELNAYYAPGVVAEVKSAYADVLSVVTNGANPNVGALFSRIDETSAVLGPDMLDAPIPIRDRIIPMLLLFILSVEVLGLATLITQEVETGTARALLTTPLRTGQFITSKALMGIILAFSQILLLIVITGKFTTAPLLLTVALLLGSFLIVGIGFLIAAVSKDNMSVLAWGMLVIIVFAIPAISVMLPGLATAWSELIPSYFLVDALHRILNFGASWSDVGRDFAILLATGVVTLLLGAAVLRRRI